MLGIGFLVDGFDQRGHCQTFGTDRRDHQLPRLIAVKAAQGIGHQIDTVDLGLGKAGAVKDRLRIGRRFRLRQTIVTHPRAGIHQTIERNAIALRHAVIVEIMRAGDLDRA